MKVSCEIFRILQLLQELSLYILSMEKKGKKQKNKNFYHNEHILSPFY